MAVNNKKVVVLGLGEVGKPLFQLISKHQEVVGIDVTPPEERITDVDVLHVCYPYEIKDFIGVTCRYIQEYNPKVTDHQQHRGNRHHPHHRGAFRQRCRSQPRARQARAHAGRA